MDTTPSGTLVEARVESFAREIAQTPLEAEQNVVRQGMNSIALIRLIARLEEEFEVELDLSEILEEPTLKTICRAVRERLGEEVAK